MGISDRPVPVPSSGRQGRLALEPEPVPPKRTNGGFTTRASSFLSRISTATVSSGATPTGTRASAIDFPSVGENVPLVISPSPFAVTTF